MNKLSIYIPIGIIAFIAFFIWYAKSNRVSAEDRSESTEILTDIDEPIDFGYKTVWIAVKTDNKIEFANILGLKKTQSSNWKSGIENAYINKIFITPQIGKWTLAVGTGLPQGDTKESIKKLEEILNKLSAKFGEAQFFGTHRVVEYCNWMKSVNGKTERIYAYVGESSENIEVFGEQTEPEKGLILFNSLCKEAESDDYWKREDLTYADEELVMKIAEKWSVNPTKLTERTDIKKELGIIGN